MGSKFLFGPNDLLIEMGMIFLRSLSFCWIFLVDIEGFGGRSIFLICWSRSIGQVETMLFLREEKNVEEQKVMYETGSSGWDMLQKGQGQGSLS